MATDITGDILGALAHKDPLYSAESFPETPFAVLKASLDRLASRDMVKYEAIDKEQYSLTKEAEEIASNGSHEAKVFDAVIKAVGGLKISDLDVSCSY
jgi:phenylalanyl-tRNA synthetase alpha chain